MADKIYKSPLSQAEELEKDYEYGDIDDDYERSYGPVDSKEKYQSYLKWKKEGN